MNKNGDDCYDLLERAIQYKDNQEVSRLVPMLDADAVPFSLWSAVANKYTHAVALLVARSECHDNEHSLWVAVSQNYVEGVKLLLPICDPRKNNSHCLQRAVLNDHMEIFELLYPVSDAQVALKQLQSSDQFDEQPDRAHKCVFVELEARVLQKTLTRHVGTVGTAPPASKM